MFPIESTSFLKLTYRFTVKVFFRCSFNKLRQWQAGMLRLGFTEITEHKNMMSLSILNYSYQCTLNQSKDSLKIFRALKRLELTGVQKLFP